jgi:hypothetical protein
MRKEDKSKEEIGYPYFIESILDENSIRGFSKRKIKQRITPLTKKEFIQEVEDFYNGFFAKDYNTAKSILRRIL